MKKIGLQISFTLAVITMAFSIQSYPQFGGILNKAKPQEKTAKQGTTSPSRGDHWFFAKASMASKKRLAVADLKVCILGDNNRPPNLDQFKEYIVATSMNQARLLNAGTCEVAWAYSDEADGLEKLKKERTGFAIYKISGAELELVFAPDTSSGGGWVAVARKGFDGGSTLSKKTLNGCGHPDLRSLFRPNPRAWLGWSQGFVKFEGLKNKHEIDTQNLLDNKGCDLWVMSSEDHPKFVKLYGAGYAVYSVDPEKDEITLKK